MSRDPWTLMRWARDQAAEHSLSATQAHVLLVLASYADIESGECHAKRITIARDVVRGERETSRALTDLARLELIERHGRGPGRPTVTRLLMCDPPRATDERPTAHQDPDARSTAHQRRAAHRAPLGGIGETHSPSSGGGFRSRRGHLYLPFVGLVPHHLSGLRLRLLYLKRDPSACVANRCAW